MGNCQSIFSIDQIWICDRLLQNERFLKFRIQQKAIKAIYKRPYKDIHSNYKKYPDEKLQTGQWWRCLF